MTETTVPTVWEKLRDRVRYLFPRVWLWSKRRSDLREIEHLNAEYAPLIEEAKAAYAANNSVDDLSRQYAIEGELDLKKNKIRDITYALQDDILKRKARKLGIRIPSKPPKGKDSDENWMVLSGYWMLTGEAERQLRKEIREEQRAREEEWRKWVTLFLVVIGTVFAFLSYRTKVKQPDSCAVNYYRNDLGACVFGLTSPVVSGPTPQSVSPQPKPTEQVSPSRKAGSPKSNTQKRASKSPNG